MLLPRLPDPVPPARHEIAVSYISRLATLHGMDSQTLWMQATRPKREGASRRVPIPEQLAALTGRNVHALAGALPELRDPLPDWAMFRHATQSGCHLCDARHPGGRVVRLLPHHTYVCLRHGTWIGPPDIDHPAAGLAQLPEVIDAQRRHHVLVRRYGWEAAYDAVLTAFMLCAHIWADGRLPGEDFHVWHTWDSRTYALIPYDHAAKSYSSYSTSKLFAAVYPEVIGLAPLIASPYWRQLACGTTTEQSRFFAEVGKRVTYPYRKKEHGDAVAHWAIADAWRPPSTPLTTYTPGQVRGKLSPLHASRAARHANSVKWYSRINRNQGRTLLFHNHLKPVLLRDKTPQYVKWEGTVWHSSRTDALIKEEVARRRKELQDGAARLRHQRTLHEGSNGSQPDADHSI
ncbi:hypothetical protein DMA15_29870 [Streptomyces sp. WAC 01529]|uniref:TniQ family protein n=1 Tax=Streptomyces sp. WAC 01529 TaxID=2203205 RepID=UPI000F6DA2A8|nr:TniQ family protein [Streptomyces sp. WAC 01529]AZM56282.1 hypothetical protein DMA15_29870 [Streptomyces sp. WAC 01529]